MQKESDQEDKDKDEENDDDTKGYDSVDLSAYDEVTATARLDKGIDRHSCLYTTGVKCCVFRQTHNRRK